VDAECKSLISICFSKIAGAPIGSLQFLASKEESMACALRGCGVTDSGQRYIHSIKTQVLKFQSNIEIKSRLVSSAIP
jgi:hypothetical protein